MRDDETPLIEHDKYEFGASPLLRFTVGLQVFVLVGIATIITLIYRPIAGWLDGLFLVGWLLLLAWCIAPSRGMDTEGHEGAGQRFAFRMGKKLNRIFHHFH